MQEDLKTTDKVLEIGTATGLIAFSISSKVQEVLALDFAPEMIAIADKKLAGTSISNVKFQVRNALNTGLPDKSIDVVIASNIFHLLSSPDKALWEIHRILKDTGTVILPTYCHGQNIKTRLISAIMGLSGFRAVNRWSVKSFNESIENEGFGVQNQIIIKDRIPLSYVKITKQN